MGECTTHANLTSAQTYPYRALIGFAMFARVLFNSVFTQSFQLELLSLLVAQKLFVLFTTQAVSKGGRVRVRGL